jgi:uncharacterized repeat protein (TIGR03803 family)
MNMVNRTTKAFGLFLCAVAAIVLPLRTTAIAPTVTFTALHSFDKADGGHPFASLIQGSDGKLYGTTNRGGDTRDGTIFNITTGGTLTSLYSFCQPPCANGFRPTSGLIQDIDGNFYGATTLGGAYYQGTVYKVNIDGEVSSLYSFCHHRHQRCPDGNSPSGLVQGSDGNFYGTTLNGGANNYGTVFRITPSGKLTTIYSFDVFGGNSPIAGLFQAADGNFYGTTFSGGSEGDGTVFVITPGGALTTLHSFHGMDGSTPQAALVEGANGKFYGTTSFGGTYRNYGTVFSVTAGGELKTLYRFDGKDGDDIAAGLVQGTDGNFYGASFAGGANEDGTLFMITPQGSLTTLHTFGGADGKEPFAALVQDTDGKFYGTTFVGGSHNHGSVFTLSVGLAPFVKTNPTSGAAGKAVNILGTNLTGATSVTFNGTAATFTLVSASEITATVPVGATTGTVQVVTPGGTLSSNVPFTVN